MGPAMAHWLFLKKFFIRFSLSFSPLKYWKYLKIFSRIMKNVCLFIDLFIDLLCLLIVDLFAKNHILT